MTALERERCPGGRTTPEPVRVITSLGGVTRAICATCGGLFRLRQDGRLRLHHRDASPAPAVDYSWAEPGQVDPRECPTCGAQFDPDGRCACTPESTQGVAAEGLAYSMGQAQAYLENVQELLQPALDALDLQDTSVVYLVAWCQAQRRLLKAVEDAATLYAGQNLQVPRTGTMADGRTYTLRRAKDRKGWDHDAWQHDARRAIVDTEVPEGALVIDSQGEVLETARRMAQRTAAAVEAVHGAAAPRLTSLRGLGLDPDEYAETTPGPWTVEFTDPTPTPTTTEDPA